MLHLILRRSTRSSSGWSQGLDQYLPSILGVIWSINDGGPAAGSAVARSSWLSVSSGTTVRTDPCLPGHRCSVGSAEQPHDHGEGTALPRHPQVSRGASGGAVARVFVSHASGDRERAGVVHRWLVEDGHEVFFAQDLRDGVAVGEQWEPRLHERLRWADAVAASVGRAGCHGPSAEVRLARGSGARSGRGPCRAGGGVAPG